MGCKVAKRYCCSNCCNNSTQFLNFEGEDVAASVEHSGITGEERCVVLNTSSIKELFTRYKVDDDRKLQFATCELVKRKKNNIDEKTPSLTLFTKVKAFVMRYYNEGGGITTGSDKNAQIKDLSNTDIGASIVGDEESLDTLIHCSICLEEYVGGDIGIKGSYCPHLFHESCLMKWLEKSNTCPFCRKDMITTEDFQEALKKTVKTNMM